MPTANRFRAFLLIAAVLVASGCASSAQLTPEPAPSLTADGAAALDTVRAGRFDTGKMWLFENPPVDYLEETYGFRPGDDWFEKARLSALRLPGCSAAFVSPEGLVVTNHHCARGSIVRVSRPGENLLDNGFYAPTLADERPIEDYYVDQLVAIEDVTDAVDARLEGIEGDAERAQAREAVLRDLAGEIKARNAGAGDSLVVQIVSLYHGGRYSAYTFHRHTDVRLVAAPELQLGYFGGDADNFTYPRYALDFAFYRIYDDGAPLRTDHYFTWSREGTEAGDVVFVIGNPGSTSRLETVAELLFRRDVQVGALLNLLDTRIAAMEAYYETAPEDERTQAEGIRNLMFGLLNAQKAYRGRQDALADPFIIARRRDAERRFVEAVEANPALRAEYGGLVEQMAEVQARKEALGADYAAFLWLENERYASALLRRALLAARYLDAQEPGASEERLAELREALLAVRNQPEGLDRRLLAAQLQDFATYLGETSAIARAATGSRTPQEAAEALVEQSVLATQESTQEALEAGTLAADPAVVLASAVLPRYDAFQAAFAAFGPEEREVAGQLGRARFAVYGTAVPPDATFSLRFADGVVKGYPYNGTEAPYHTTFHGLYDHYYSYGPGTAWDLPERWLNPPATFDRSTPLNFVSTSDTIGGNSGSPVVTPDLEIVGLNFDRNIEGLSRDYIFLPERGRNIMVDVRAILEALDDIYDADRIVEELTR